MLGKRWGPSLPASWKRASRSPHRPGAAGQEPAERLREASGTTNAGLQRLEAALWLAAEPLTERRLTKVAGLPGVARTRELVQELRRRLAARRSGLEVVEFAGGLALRTRPSLAPWLERFAGRQAAGGGGKKLSPTAAETATIVAYRQPINRAEIEAIRGVGCADVLRQLLEAGLLRIVGRSEELGRPLLYGTTGRFLEVYGLGSLDDLPARAEGTDDAGPNRDNAANDHAA